MGIIVSKDEDKNIRLQEKINSDLRARAQSSRNGKDPDLVEDSAYAKDFKKTGRFSWVWIVLIVLAAISLVSIILI